MPIRDDLGRRLDRAAGPSPDPEPALASLGPRLGPRLAPGVPRRDRRVAVVLAVGLIGLVGAWLLGRGSSDAPQPVTSVALSTTTASSTSVAPAVPPATVPATPPPGYVTVADHEGNPVGYVVANADLEPLPTFALGTGAPLAGQRVVDAAGHPNGYFIVGLGYVSDDQAGDRAEIDRLVAEHEAFQAEAEAQLREERGGPTG
ncbi:MAG: hypothetical protein KDB04_07635 [Acidimicrobiales bacterium]|nr:hypothetical protein [Acidimicrobiales bacterium]